MEEDSKHDFPRSRLEDSVLDRYLESLPGFDPYPGFEDRVMSRVYAPPPRWMQSVRGAVLSLVENRRARWVGAGLLATSAVTTVAVATFALNNLSTVSRLVDSAAARMWLPSWQAVLGLSTEAAREVYACGAPLFGSRGTVLMVSAAAVGFLIADALVLLCLMRPKCFTRSE